ncbi:MAG TPA: porin family protein [Cytophagaceae bacterium]|jgi:hypothetical protein|nr:porin family protein [Cytophagaceae bacterium]
MRKIILIISIVVFITSNSNAQNGRTDLRSKLMFGVKAGLNYSNVYDSEGENFNSNPRVGFVTGAFMSVPIGRYIGIQPEFLFSQRGFQATGGSLTGSYNFTRITDNIDVPLLFAFKPSEFLTLLAGPQYSYLMKRRDEFANETTTIEQEKQFDNDNIRKNILCFTGGLDLTLKRFVFSARVGWAVQKNNGDGTSSTPRYKDVWYQTTVGYRFYR